MIMLLRSYLFAALGILAVMSPAIAEELAAQSGTTNLRAALIKTADASPRRLDELELVEEEPGPRG